MPNGAKDGDLILERCGYATEKGSYQADWCTLVVPENRDWSRRTKTMGVAAALAGALVGAWLGLNVIAGLYGVLPAIIGAAVGANLSLLFLDGAWDRQVCDRVATTKANETLGARPSTG